MKYADLIEFKPIETVVQLRNANREKIARNLVEEYVISDDMAERLIKVVFRQLQFEVPADNKGLFIVGNYGTGKSHLMSVISAVAEKAELAPLLRKESVAQVAKQIAGKFKVVRTELGATTMSFRNFVCSQLEANLSDWGVEYKFPDQDKIPNHKGAFEDMMASFDKKYPGQGILFIVDEFLDYLRTRHDQQLISDLGFLRELGEICKDLRFRFISGVQEKIIDNERFKFASDELTRVKARFEEVLISRTDVKYVVAERLLGKTGHQHTLIRNHLKNFTRFYSSMNERLDEYVRLFPIHPDFFEVFEQVRYGEQREAFKAVSAQMRDLLDQEVPEDEPGLVSYDSYWQSLKSTHRTNPDIKAVVDVADVLEARVDQSFTRKAYRPMAHRIIRALALQRLTVGDLSAPIGVTPENLRDGLTLYDPLVAEMGGDLADDLLTQVETVLKETVKTVSGQFISENKDNRQYYLDLKKTDDYDAIIDRRIESLEPTRRDRYFFEGLKRVLELTDASPVVSGYRIWQYETEWREHKTTRLGYLFFGAPNERSTAQPPRDFYLYFLQPYAPPVFKDEKRPDEVFFKLHQPDKAFTEVLNRYAAASELALSSSGSAKAAYQNKAEGFLRELNSWLREHIATAFEVTYRGQTKPFMGWNKGQLVPAGRSANVRDVLNSISSSILASWFEELAPEYPTFTVNITKENREGAAKDALRWISKPFKSQVATAVLAGLELLEGERLSPEKSRYARFILDLMQQKGPGQVINRSEVMENVYGLDYLRKYRLEPEWVVVLLAVLVYQGEITLALGGNQKFDAGNLAGLVSLPLTDLANFKHIEAPKDWNLPALVALFELVGLNPGQAQLLTQNSIETHQKLQSNITDKVNLLVEAAHQLQAGLAFWDSPLLSPELAGEYREQLNRTKQFLEGLQSFNQPARFKNFKASVSEVHAQQPGLIALEELTELNKLVEQLTPAVNYLAKARLALPADDPLAQRIEECRENLAAALQDSTQRNNGFARQAELQLTRLRQEYANSYLNFHSRSRLNKNLDGRKARLLNQDQRTAQLKSLATLVLMPGSSFHQWLDSLAGLKTCFALVLQDLEKYPLCPHCQFNPVAEQHAVTVQVQLDQLEVKLAKMVEDWTNALLDNLDDPMVQSQLNLLQPAERRQLDPFMAKGQLPDKIEQPFIEALKQLFGGLSKVDLRVVELRQALLQGGSPTTAEDLRKRFEVFLQELLSGQDAGKVRIVID